MKALSSRLYDQNSPERRPRRAAYALPTLFTAGNLFLGFLAIVKCFEGAMLATRGHLGHNPHLEAASIMIGVSVFLDGLDGRIARLTRTTSDFGRELDSLADCITFGLAPAVLAWVFGFHFLSSDLNSEVREQIYRAGYFVTFLFLLCGASRLARFNIQDNPIPKNPGHPSRKYFVGLPVPGAAAILSAIVYAANSTPLDSWPLSLAWLALILALSLLMVSTWRYRSFKDFNLLRPRSPRSVVLIGSFLYLIWNYSQPVLLAMAVTYVSSGVIIRVGGIIKRRLRSAPPREPQHQTS